MVNQLYDLEALVACDVIRMTGDFGKLDSHPSLQTIKLLTDICTCKAFTSALGLWQLQELWIMDLGDTAFASDVVSSSLVFLITVIFASKHVSLSNDDMHSVGKRLTRRESII